MKKILNSNILVPLFLLLIFAFAAFMAPHNMALKRSKFISLKGEITEEMLMHEHYSCCLAKPCTSCIATSYHGEGASCSCLDDVMNGRHPCGECIGGILAGRGNPLIAEYFAEAISEKTGHKEAIMQIIEEKYNISVSKQV